MSNPGVIILTENYLNNHGSLRIEDNIGECIHIHIGEIRIDLSIDSFFDLSSQLKSILFQMTSEELSNHKFNYTFLEMIGDGLLDLKTITVESININKLLIQTKGFFGLPIIRNLSKSRVFKGLNGNIKELEKYHQDNYYGYTNIDRMNYIFDSVKKNGYPFNAEYIVLFNYQNIIRDGQHRAASILKLYGSDKEIPIIRMHFYENKHNSSRHPWIKTIFYWNKPKIKSLIKITYKNIKWYIKRIYWKLKRM